MIWVGEPFVFQLTAWGGDGNYSWSIVEDALPPGIILDAAKEQLIGTPSEVGNFRVVIQVEDTALVDHTGKQQKVVQEFYFPVVVKDTDNDGMPDTWEVQYGLDPLDPSDAAQDLDGDEISNLDEFLAGTDPTIGVVGC